MNEDVNENVNEAGNEEVELDDDVLEQASGGVNNNSTMLIYSSTFVPFDSSF
jgi:hypothetical protein